MRILHVIAELGVGGGERVVIQLAGDAVARGDQVAVASAGGVWLPQLQAVGATHHQTTLALRRPLVAAGTASRLAEIIAAVDPDVIHTHSVAVTMTTRLGMVLEATTARGRRVLGGRFGSGRSGGGRAIGGRAMGGRAMVTTVHGLAPGDYPNAARLLRVGARLVVACAPAVERRLTAAGMPRRRVETITNGARLEPADRARVAAMAERLTVDGRPLVVGLGRLVAQKSWPTLIDAARQLDDVDVVVAGTGELDVALGRAAAAAGGTVRFVGRVDDVPALLALATCAVSVSSWEGLPLSLLELLSLGVPAVVTAVDGVTDVVPADAALMVAPGDPSAVAAGIRALIDEPDRAARLGAAARAASASWTPDTMLASYRAVYERLSR